MSPTRNKSFLTNMLRALIILTFLCFVHAHGILTHFRDDGFVENVLENFTNFEIDAVGHSLLRLKDDSVVITGVLWYPHGMQNYTTFEDEEQILAYHNDTQHSSSLAGMVMRVHRNGTTAWAKRTVLCDFDTTFTSVHDDEYIYVAGATIGVPIGLGTPDCCTEAAGMVLLKYNINGTQEAIMVHGDPGEKYTAISLTPAESDTIFLTSCTPTGAGPYVDVDSSVWPLDSGLTVSRVRKRDLVAVQQEIISDAVPVAGELIKDRFWDMAVSKDGSRIFVTALREVLRFGYSRTPVLFAISSNNLTTAHTRLLDNELQVDTRLATSRVSDGLFVSYVDRTSNKEHLVVRHVGKNLSDVPREGGVKNMLRYRILLETEYLKEIRSTVKNVFVDDTGTASVLLYSAEVVNRSLGSRESPPPSFEIHRKLTNGRPAVVTISRRMEIGEIIQAQTAQQWEPYGMIVGVEHDMITGADRGLIFDGNSKILLTGVKRQMKMETPEPTISASPSGRPPVASASPNVTGTVIDCVGESTRLNGRSVKDIVRSDDRLRLQIHPWRWGRRVTVLCHSWKNGTEDMLCATGDHVVRYWGKLMYMKDFCKMVGCVTRIDGVTNFKGICGGEVRAHDVLSVTMHAGGLRAWDTVRKECEMMERTKLWWWLTTL